VKTNLEILASVNEERSMISMIARRKNWLGHILRGGDLLKGVMKWTMEGKSTRERKRIGMIDD